MSIPATRSHDPEDSRAALISALLAVRNGRWRDAEELFRPIMTQSAVAGPIWLTYSAVAWHLGDAAAAHDRLRIAALLAPSDPAIVVEVTRSLTEGADALLFERWTRRAVLVRPLDPAMHVGRARSTGLGIRRSAGARQSIRRACILAPDLPEATLVLAQVETALWPWYSGTPYADRIRVCCTAMPRAWDMLLFDRLRAGDGEGAAYWFGRTAPRLEERLAAMLLEPGEAVLDVGGHRGVTVLGFLRAGAARVHVIEPNPELAELLRSTMPAAASIYPVALSNHEGSVTLTMPTGRPGSASIDPTFNTEMVAASPGGGQTVAAQARTLDGLGLERCAFWKLDVEGAEVDVLKGASNTLRTAPPDWLIAEIFAEPFRPPGHLERFSKLLRDALPYRYEVLAGTDGDIRLRPLADDMAPTPGARRGTSTPLYLFAAKPLPEAVP